MEGLSLGCPEAEDATEGKTGASGDPGTAVARGKPEVTAPAPAGATDADDGAATRMEEMRLMTEFTAAPRTFVGSAEAGAGTAGVDMTGGSAEVVTLAMEIARIETAGMLD